MMLKSRFIALWGDDAAEYKPERWLDEQSNLIAPPLAWQPFSKGPKNCIGMEFGILEQKILLAMTVYFTFHLVGKTKRSKQLTRVELGLQIRKFDFEYAGEQDPYQIFRLTVRSTSTFLDLIYGGLYP